MHRGKPTPNQLLKLVARIQNGDIQCQILGTYQALLDYVYEIVLAFPLFNLIPHMLKNPYREYTVRNRAALELLPRQRKLLWICSTGTTSRNAPIATSSDKPARLDSSSDRQIILKTSKTSLPARCSGAAISDSPLGPTEDTVSTGIEFQKRSLPSETLKFVFLVDRRGSWVQVECSKIPSDNCFFKELRQIEKDRRFGERGLITFFLQSVNWFVLHVDQINYVKVSCPYFWSNIRIISADKRSLLSTTRLSTSAKALKFSSHLVYLQKHREAIIFHVAVTLTYGLLSAHTHWHTSTIIQMMQVMAAFCWTEFL